MNNKTSGGGGGGGGGGGRGLLFAFGLFNERGGGGLLSAYNYVRKISIFWIGGCNPQNPLKL